MKSSGTRTTLSRLLGDSRQATKVRSLQATSEELKIQNDQLKGDLSMVSNQKRLLDTMKEEMQRMADHQKNMSARIIEQAKEIQHKDSLITRFRETYESNGQE